MWHWFYYYYQPLNFLPPLCENQEMEMSCYGHIVETKESMLAGLEWSRGTLRTIASNAVAPSTWLPASTFKTCAPRQLEGKLFPRQTTNIDGVFRSWAVPSAAQRGPAFHQLPWDKALSEPWSGRHCLQSHSIAVWDQTAPVSRLCALLGVGQRSMCHGPHSTYPRGDYKHSHHSLN
jgi:hypothetical protein